MNGKVKQHLNYGGPLPPVFTPRSQLLTINGRQNHEPWCIHCQNDGLNDNSHFPPHSAIALMNSRAITAPPVPGGRGFDATQMHPAPENEGRQISSHLPREKMKMPKAGHTPPPLPLRPFQSKQRCVVVTARRYLWGHVHVMSTNLTMSLWPPPLSAFGTDPYC